MNSRSRLIYKNILYFMLTFLLIMTEGCSKQEIKNEIPVVPVNFVIYPNSTEYLELNGPGGSVPVTGGYRGIIIYRISMTDFVAFERACPNDWQQSTARIEVETSGTTAVCPSCKSKFILLDGSVFQGVSHYPLKQYQTQYDGNQLHVYN